MARWIHPEKARYYQAELVKDLLGDWTVFLCRGGLGSRRGVHRIQYVASHEAGLARLEAIGERRGKRGYVQPSAQHPSEAELVRRARKSTAPSRARRAAMPPRPTSSSSWASIKDFAMAGYGLFLAPNLILSSGESMTEPRVLAL